MPQIEASLREDLLVISDPSPGNSKNKKDKMTPTQVNGGGGNLNKTTVITKNFVLDYTSPLQRVIMETETGGFTYRVVYGLQKLSVVVSPVNKGGGGLVQNNKVKLWYHIDRLNSVDYMSDNVSGKVASYIDYDEYGLPLKKNVLKLDARELDMAIDYTGHAWDAVLGLYYAKARMYDAADRRFVAADPVRGKIIDTATLLQYIYTLDNPLIFIDSLGLKVVIAVAGEDKDSNHNAFINNIDTFKRDNPKDTVIVLKAWDYDSADKLMNAIINSSNSMNGIDVLLIESHGSTVSLIVSASYYLDKSANWAGINFNERAFIKFTGCNSGGYAGEVISSSIAQHVANETQRDVWAFVNSTSQKAYDKNGNETNDWQKAEKYYQTPVRMSPDQKLESRLIRFVPETKLEPIVEPDKTYWYWVKWCLNEILSALL